MKKLLYIAVAAMVALSSCGGDDVINDNDNQNENQNVNDNHNEKANATVFTATIEGEGETRTTLALNSETGKLTKVNWANGDQISINGKVYSTTSTGSTASFTAVDGIASAVTIAEKDLYIASYPSTIVLTAATVNSIPTITGTFPATQTCDAATNGIGNVPMAAVSTTTELKFKNICAVLAITVPGTEMPTVKSIKVTSDKQMNGNCYVSFSDATTFDGPSLAFAAPVQDLTPLDKQITLDCGSSGVSITSGESHTFYIAIPAQTYAYLNIYLSADGTTYKEAMATRKPAGLGTLARNTIYPINYVRNAVQLCENGPYFAEFNVGSTITSYANIGYRNLDTDNRSSIFGGLYCWGCKEDVRSSYPTNLFQVANLQGSLELPDEYDVASASWGANWKIPSKNDIHLLFTGIINDIDNGGGSTHFNVSASNSSNYKKSSNYVDWNYCDGTTVKYVDSCTLPGYKITGNQSGYTGNSIFLPYTGRRLCVSGTIDCNKAGYYWLSSCYANPNNYSVSPYFLSFMYEQDPGEGLKNIYTFTCTYFSNAFAQYQWEAYAVRPVLRQ